MHTTDIMTEFERALCRAATDGTYRTAVLARAHAGPSEVRLTPGEWQRLRRAVRAQEAEHAELCGRAGRAAAGRLRILTDLSR